MAPQSQLKYTAYFCTTPKEVSFAERTPAYPSVEEKELLERCYLVPSLVRNPKNPNTDSYGCVDFWSIQNKKGDKVERWMPGYPMNEVVNERYGIRNRWLDRQLEKKNRVQSMYIAWPGLPIIYVCLESSLKTRREIHQFITEVYEDYFGWCARTYPSAAPYVRRIYGALYSMNLFRLVQLSSGPWTVDLVFSSPSLLSFWSKGCQERSDMSRTLTAGLLGVKKLKSWDRKEIANWWYASAG
ncbi:hypothetical protein CPB86DRAFT_781352 [Serendipita vermifera]|nr:hypothetical protein CPB86DRAFT_781352 [Serendipita vermifera]